MATERNILHCLLINDEVDFGNIFSKGLSEELNIKITEVNDYTEAKQLILQKKFSLIVLNLNSAELNILNLCHECKEAGDLPLLLVLPSVEYLFIKRYLLRGNAWGFCILNETKNEIKDAIQYFKKGKRYISREMMELLVEDILSSNEPKHGAEVDPKRVELLDEKEFEIFTHLSRNRKDDTIARILEIHPSAVGLYRDRIFEKLRIKEMNTLKRLVSAEI